MTASMNSRIMENEEAPGLPFTPNSRIRSTTVMEHNIRNAYDTCRQQKFHNPYKEPEGFQRIRYLQIIIQSHW